MIVMLSLRNGLSGRSVHCVTIMSMDAKASRCCASMFSGDTVFASADVSPFAPDVAMAVAVASAALFGLFLWSVYNTGSNM